MEMKSNSEPTRVLDVELPNAYNLEVQLNEDETKRMAIKHAKEEQARNRKGRLMTAYDRQTIERAARMYESASAAARALSMSSGQSFSNICKQYGIETPVGRKKKKAAADQLQMDFSQ